MSVVIVVCLEEDSHAGMTAGSLAAWPILLSRDDSADSVGVLRFGIGRAICYEGDHFAQWSSCELVEPLTKSLGRFVGRVFSAVCVGFETPIGSMITTSYVSPCTDLNLSY